MNRIQGCRKLAECRGGGGQNNEYRGVGSSLNVGEGGKIMNTGV